MHTTRAFKSGIRRRYGFRLIWPMNERISSRKSSAMAMARESGFVRLATHCLVR